MTKKHLVIVSMAVLATLLLTGCAAGMNPTVDVLDADGESAGFWSGMWHGVISPVTFFISLFSDNVNIYEVYNSGIWFDFGFMFGVSIILGGGAGSGARAARRKSK